MKRIEFIASNDRQISFRVSEIAVVLAKHSPTETVVYVTGSDDGFVVKGSYVEVMRRIEGAEAENVNL
jgi:hypothetical protein